MNGEEFLCLKARSNRSAAILAQWPGNHGIDTDGDAPRRVGLITSFLRHVIKIVPQGTCDMQQQELSHVLATVKWYEPHSFTSYLRPSVVIMSSIFSPFSCASFMPVSRISARCAYLETTFNFSYGDDKIVVCVPLHKKFHS